jgi:hypothetical protein
VSILSRFRRHGEIAELARRDGWTVVRLAGGAWYAENPDPAPDGARVIDTADRRELENRFPELRTPASPHTGVRLTQTPATNEHPSAHNGLVSKEADT